MTRWLSKTGEVTAWLDGSHRTPRLVLAWPVGRPEAVRRQQCLAGVVTGVVGDAVPDGELVSSGSFGDTSSAR